MALTHKYRLANSLTDDLGGSSLVSLGGTLSVNGYAFAANAGLTLSSAVPTSVYSIAVDFYFTSVAEAASTSGWQKIIDCKNRTTDSGLYWAAVDAEFGVHLSSGLLIWDAGLLANAGVGTTDLQTQESSRVLVTRDGANLVSVYLEGALEFSFTDATSLMTFSEASQIAHFFVDDTAQATDTPAGTVTGIRIYDAALTSTEAAAEGVGGKNIMTLGIG